MKLRAHAASGSRAEAVPLYPLLHSFYLMLYLQAPAAALRSFTPQTAHTRAALRRLVWVRISEIIFYLFHEETV
jgi:hypothetical protein